MSYCPLSPPCLYHTVSVRPHFPEANSSNDQSFVSCSRWKQGSCRGVQPIYAFNNRKEVELGDCKTPRRTNPNELCDCRNYPREGLFGSTQLKLGSAMLMLNAYREEKKPKKMQPGNRSEAVLSAVPENDRAPKQTNSQGLHISNDLFNVRHPCIYRLANNNCSQSTHKIIQAILKSISGFLIYDFKLPGSKITITNSKFPNKSKVKRKIKNSQFNKESLKVKRSKPW